MIFQKIKYKINFYYVNIVRFVLVQFIKKNNKVIWFLVPEGNNINGGVMSISSIYKEYKGYSNLHESTVVASTYSYSGSEAFLKFNKFESEMYVFSFRQILHKNKKATHLQIHIPELLLENFIKSFLNDWSDSDRKILLGIKHLSINILNQNDLLMPKVEFIELIKEKMTQNITMTIAHKNYATIEKRNQYNVPIHYLSAWVNLTPYEVIKYNKKENIILFSPDDLSRLNIKYHLSKDDLISKLKLELPMYDVIVIKNLKYQAYKTLIARSKFMITFGEGLDGYLVETILSGGISFAVYNDKFFTEDYLDIPTLYHSVDGLFSGIINKIKTLDNEEDFQKTNAVSREVIEREYSYDKYVNRVENFVKGNYDFK